MKKQFLRRLIFACAIIILCVSALLARKAAGYSPNFFNTYYPDTAWTMAVYCGFGLIFNRGKIFNLSAAIITSYIIEISQLFSMPLLSAARSTVIGGLILGYGFLWSDIICYTVGALLCFTAEILINRINKHCHSDKTMIVNRE